jgi:hypothetical protein
VRFVVEGATLAEVPVEAAREIEADMSMWSRALDSIMIMVFGS